MIKIIHIRFSHFICHRSRFRKDEKKVLNYFNEVLSINTLKNEDLDLIKFKKAIFISNDSNEKEY